MTDHRSSDQVKKSPALVCGWGAPPACSRTSIVALAVLLACLMLAPSPAPARAQLPLDVFRVYTYDQMASDIETLAAAYPDAVQQVDIIGYSVYGRPLWAVKVGQGEASVLVNGSHHAREWISTSVVIKMLEAYAHAYERGESYQGYDVRPLLDQVSIWFIPMVNPDGVELQQRGLASFPREAHDSLVAMNEGSRDFSRWKANARGVDPNRQYPVRWDSVLGCPGRPSHSNYRGPEPLSEPETRAMAAFTREVLPWMSASYHSSGRVIFFPSDSPHQSVAQGLAGITGYRLFPLTRPAAGYTDWFVETFRRPAYTPELSYRVGPTNPPVSVIPAEWERNRKVGLYLAQRSLELYGPREDTGRVPWEEAPAWAPGYEHYRARDGSLRVPLGPWAQAQDAELWWRPNAETLTVKLQGQELELPQPEGFRGTDRTESMPVDPDRLPPTVAVGAETLLPLMKAPPLEDQEAPPETRADPGDSPPEEETPDSGNGSAPATDPQAGEAGETVETGDSSPSPGPVPPEQPSDLWADAGRIELTVGSADVHVDGRPVLGDAAPFIENGRTYVPVRLVAEIFQAEADWMPRDAPVERVTLEREGLQIVLDLEEPRLAVTRDGVEQVQELDAMARLRDGRTFLPFRALASAFEEEVDYATDDEGRVTRVWFNRSDNN